MTRLPALLVVLVLALGLTTVHCASATAADHHAEAHRGAHHAVVAADHPDAASAVDASEECVSAPDTAVMTRELTGGTVVTPPIEVGLVAASAPPAGAAIDPPAARSTPPPDLQVLCISRT